MVDLLILINPPSCLTVKSAILQSAASTLQALPELLIFKFVKSINSLYLEFKES